MKRIVYKCLLNTVVSRIYPINDFIEYWEELHCNIYTM